MFRFFRLLFYIFAAVSQASSYRNDSVYIEDPNCGTSYAPLSEGISLRIVGGSETQSGEFPWLVSLQYNNRHMCGGSILNGRFILTAAHCFQDTGIGQPGKWRIVAGRHRLSATGIGSEIQVKKILLHSGYSSTSNENDIAVLKLLTAMPTYSQTIAPVCIPTSSLDLAPRTPLTVAGWGKTDYNDPIAISDTMRRVEVYTYDTERCATVYRFLVNGASVVPRGMMCAGDLAGGKDSCQGDSGGPLMQKGQNGRWTQVGIVSWGASCGRRLLAGVYTKVAPYRSWIEDTIAKNKAGNNPSTCITLTLFTSLLSFQLS